MLRPMAGKGRDSSRGSTTAKMLPPSEAERRWPIAGCFTASSSGSRDAAQPKRPRGVVLGGGHGLPSKKPTCALLGFIELSSSSLPAQAVNRNPHPLFLLCR